MDGNAPALDELFPDPQASPQGEAAPGPGGARGKAGGGTVEKVKPQVEKKAPVAAAPKAPKKEKKGPLTLNLTIGQEVSYLGGARCKWLQEGAKGKVVAQYYMVEFDGKRTELHPRFLKKIL